LVCIAGLILSTVFATEVSTEQNSPGKLLKDESVSYNYGVGSTGGYTLRDDAGYVKPQFVPHLEQVARWARSFPKKETVDEVPSAEDYYDGSDKLNNVRVDCEIFTDKRDCLTSSHCGWCGSRNCCVTGTALGPAQRCDRTTYIFSNNPNLRKNILTGSLGEMILKPVTIQMIKKTTKFN